MSIPAVVSFPRSGTHWLCSLIHQWFYCGEKMCGPMITVADIPFLSWQSTGECPWLGLIGGHIYDPDSEMAKALRPRKIIYLYRHYHEVLPSLWRLRCARIAHDKELPSFSEFLNKSPVEYNGEEAFLRNPIPKGVSILDLCKCSQSKWSTAQQRSPDVCMIFYRDLLEDLDGVRNWIALFLGMSPEPLRFPADRRVGYIVPQGQFTNDELWEMVT